MKFEKRGDRYRARMKQNGKSYAVWFDHEPTEKEAMLALAEKISQSGDVVTDTIFKYALKKYIEDRSNTASPATLRGYKTIERTLPDRLMMCKVSEINQDLLQSVMNELSATRSPKTIRNIHGLVSAVVRVYRPNITFNTSLPAKVNPEYHIPTEDEIKAIRKASEGTRYEIPVLLGCFALRRSEICALDINTDIDWNNNIVHVNKAKVLNSDGEWVIKNVTKTTEGKRDVEVPEEVINRIKEVGAIFDGNPNRITHWMIETERKLGIKEFSFHKLRHYYASAAHALGVPDAYIQKQGGWKSAQVLNTIYKHALEEKAQEESAVVRDHMKQLLF